MLIQLFSSLIIPWATSTRPLSDLFNLQAIPPTSPNTVRRQWSEFQKNCRREETRTKGVSLAIRNHTQHSHAKAIRVTITKYIMYLITTSSFQTTTTNSLSYGSLVHAPGNKGTRSCFLSKLISSNRGMRAMMSWYCRAREMQSHFIHRKRAIYQWLIIIQKIKPLRQRHACRWIVQLIR